MEIEKLLEREIQERMEELNTMDAGTEEYQTMVNDITKLTDRVIEIKKVHNERLVADQNYLIKDTEMNNERKDRIIKNCLTGASIVTGVGLTVWGTLKSLRFELDGTVTTIVGRGFINKLLPKK